MSSKHDLEFDPTKPALVLIYGNSAKKHRPLDRDVVVVGRARGCDVGLDAPDISSIHCIISRGAGGYQLRDCQSRAGTKLNGNNVRESPLRDGDVLQLGPFSFRLNLPGGAAVAPIANEKGRLEHIQHSRRNLARIALRQRKMIRLQGVLNLGGAGSGKSGKGQLTKQLSTLKARVRDYDQRVRALEDSERELSKEREAHQAEVAEFRAKSQQGELELAERLRQSAVDNQKKVEDQSRQQEQRLRDLDALARQLQFREQQLQGRLEPVEAHERQLDAKRDELVRREQALREQLQTLEREQKELSMTRDQLARDQKSILNRVGQQKAALALAEEALHEQRQSLNDLLESLQSGDGLPDMAVSAQLDQLRAENEELRQLLAQRPESSGALQEDLLLFQRDNEELRQALAEAQKPREQPNAAPSAELFAEIASLRKLLQDRDAALEELRSRPAYEPIKDIDSYEAELNEFRRQLETDRKKLVAESELLRLKNEELDEATRELELEMSRDRAEIARERQRLDRMREDVRLDVERMQRESGLRDRLAPVHNLRDHINSRR